MMRRRAFTLLEIVLATGIFMTVMVVAIGIFISTTSSSSMTGQLRINAQAARFAFESMTRESRLSKGLVYQDPAQGPIFVLPPFEVRTVNGKKELVIYRVNKVESQITGDNRFVVDCRIYRVNEEQLEVLFFSSSPTTIHGMRTAISPTADASGRWSQATGGDVCQTPVAGQSVATNFWQLQSRSEILSKDVRLATFDFPAYHNYPFSPDKLTVQPFIRITLSVASKGAVTVANGRRLRTTLQTMIVPRDFATKYEVFQEGIEGGGQ